MMAPWHTSCKSNSSIPDVRSEHDKNFYENAWKVHKEQGSLKDFAL